MKEQQNAPEEELNEREANNLSDIEFRIIIIRILNCMEKRYRNHEKCQSEIKNAILEINNTLGGINSRLDEAENQICDLEDKAEENTQAGQQKEKKNN